MDSPGDRRDKERLRTDGRLGGEVMVFQPLRVVDISDDGALVETPFRLQLDSLHEFRLSLGNVSVVVKGRVAHCRIEELRNDVPYYRAGVEFIEPTDHVRAAIAGFVRSLRQSMGQAIIDGEIAGRGDSL
jgi:hypothetical protein